MEFLTNLSKDRDLTNGSISGSIWHLALPLVAANILQSAFGIVDMWWVSRIPETGKQSIAAVGISGPAMFVMFTAIIGIVASTTAFVARYVGAGRQRDAEDVAFQSLILGAVLSLGAANLGFFLARPVFVLMGATQEVVELSTGYIRIICGGSVVLFLLFMIGAILRGAGDAVTPTIILILSVVLNAVLDPILIFGIGPFPKMDVNGAALATVISRAIGCAIGFYALFSGRLRLKLSLKDFTVDFGVMGKLIKVGVPNSAMMMMRSLMGFAMMWIVTGFGTNALAAYGIGMRVFNLILFPAFGIAMAPVTLVGQNLGAGKPRRAEKSSWLSVAYLSIIMGGASLIFFIFSRYLMGFFSENAEVVSIGVSYLRITSPFYVAIAFGLTFSRALTGAGDTVSPAVITFVCLWLLQVPLAVLLSRYTPLGVTGVWWATAAAMLLQGIITTVWFSTGRWKHKEL
jgi:putative MATE family efflux protein